jgi:phenylacetate-CoA ligase
MNSIEVIKKFIESNWVIERAVREVLERLPLRFRYGISYGPTFRYWLGFLRESEEWDRDRFEAYQVEQMRSLLIHAGKNVPYYSKIFKEYGFKSERVQSLDDIKVLPYLDRITIKERYHEFIATNIPKNRLISATTSGTKGIPLIVCGTKETEERHWATVVDLWSRIGYSPRSRAVFFDANIREGNRENLPWKMHGNKLVLSSNYFIDEWLDKYVEMINNFKPEYIMGFPHMITTFSSFARNKRRTIFEGLKGIIVYSENVYKWQRQLIKETFGTRVFSDYGMVEKVIHGGECENSHAYHLYPQYGFTEYLPSQNSQELVGTGFINYAMPLIRYRTGDICTKDGNHCLVCGRDYDLLEEIEGRIGDFLVNVDEQIISVNLNIDFRVFENIERFQLYQEYQGKVELRIWPKDSYKDGDANRILSEIKRSLGLHGYKIKFNVALMDNGKIQHSGKYRMIEQRLDIRKYLL